MFKIFWLVTIVPLIANVALAQEIRGKTIVYSYAGTRGEIYIASSGGIYSSYGMTRGIGGIEYKLGRTSTYTHKNSACQTRSSANLSGNTLTLDAVSTCPGQQLRTVSHTTVAMLDAACRMHIHIDSSSPQTGEVSSGGDAESCSIRQGNQLVR